MFGSRTVRAVEALVDAVDDAEDLEDVSGGEGDEERMSGWKVGDGEKSAMWSYPKSRSTVGVGASESDELAGSC